MTLTPLEPWIAGKIGCGDGKLLRQALEQWQLDKLRQTIDLARSRSPFYRERLKDHGAPLHALSGLGSLPFTSAEELRSRPLRFLCVSQSEIKRVVTLRTSGTTGEPKRLYFTAADIEHTLDFFAAGMSTFTQPGDRVLILLPGELPDSVGDLLARSLDRIGACGVKHGPVRDAAHTLAVIQQERITCLVGIPTQVLGLARCASGRVRDITSVLLTTDYVPDTIRKTIENTWGCRVYNHYGMTEMGLGGGVDCTERQGYHLREADLYFEIIDPAKGAPLPDGQTGEVVFTTLARTGMPLIRYRTGDLARFLPSQCSCGTVLRLMEHIQGRHGAGIEIGSGRSLTIQALDEALFPIKNLIDFHATVSRHSKTICLNLELKTSAFRRSGIAKAAQEALLQAPGLCDAFSEGRLYIGNITFNESTWLTDGVAKRKIFTAGNAACTPEKTGGISLDNKVSLDS